ncbi:MAG: DNA translocase FtsK 4TM domain-containing protein, partial [Clostridiales bacterium]|nr:DNA translocase FtsK 4TM domain-containing protein [Clostridiales bacterium]
MAKTSGKKKSPRSPARPAASRRKEPFSPRALEITGIAVIALALLLLCCIALAPAAGEDINALGAVSLLLLELMRFLAGNAAISLPLCLLTYGALLILGRYKAQSGIKLGGLITLWAALLGLFSLSLPLLRFPDYISKAALGEGGGFIGGLISYVLQKAFGYAGSLIVLIALAVIGLLLFTESSLTDMLRGLFSAIGSFFGRLRAGAESPAKNRRDNLPEGQEPRRRPPLIISHDDPAPMITEPREAEASLPPLPNRFSAEYLPDIDAFGENVGAEKPKPARAKKNPSPRREEAAKADDIPINMGSGEDISAYRLPPVELVESGVKIRNPQQNKAITDSIALLENTLGNFGVKATVTQVVAGPAVTRYELQPAPGVKVARIVSLSDDIALALAATAVRIEAPIPGKSAIGIEVARNQIDTVYFREVLESPEFVAGESRISFALGKNIG